MNYNIPMKPWEISGLNSTVSYNTNNINSNIVTDRLHSSPIPYPGSGGGSVMSNTGAGIGNSGDATSTSVGTPPLPPRPGQTRPLYSATSSSMYSPYNRLGTSSYMSPYSSPYASSYGGYGTGYSPYSTGSYYGSRLGMGGYGGYGGMPGMMGGMNPDGQPNFFQLAEESSASAFQSIESFVSAFGSISAMLESTFHAVYSSFRAVIGVADHMGRLKHFLSAMAVFRFLRWTVRRFLYLIGISKVKPEVIESLWSSLSAGAAGDDKEIWESELQANAKGSSWPIFMFLSFILAGPYLMWKLMSSLNLNSSPKANKGWASGETDHFLAECLYDFEGMADRELKIQSGQKIRLAPAACQPPNVKGWVLGSDGVKIGLVPTNYIKILGKRTGGPLNNNTNTISTRPLNDDLNLSPRSFPLPPTSSAFLAQQQAQQAAPVLVSNQKQENTVNDSCQTTVDPVEKEKTPDIVVTPPAPSPQNPETSS